ncbi:MAG: hypothetical protein H6719_38825, partial [Sandaracinaceae bacterium]|nr:hypothetical protein [Sandaracinaceae bacterium]
TDAGTDAGSTTDAGTDAGSATDAGMDASVADAGTDAGPAGCACGTTEYCDYAMPNACGGPGTCRPRPGICTGLFDPQCGCDGMTYSNECAAHAAGVDVASAGMCDCRTTGCTTGQSCMLCRGTGGPVYVCLPGGTAC